MNFQFTKATKEKAKARVAIIGPSGCGKTYTGLTFAQALGDNVALIDTENGSASKYADEFEFSTLNLDTYSPQTYVQAIEAAQKAGFDVLVIDSLSHAWTGKGGALEMVDKAAARYKGNSFAAWRDVTPHHNALVDALVQCDLHLIVTMRAKTTYDVQKDNNGKVKPVKIGLAPIQRDGLEYEFDIVADMDLEHNFIVSKTRCRMLDNAIIAKPDSEVAETIKAWLGDGAVPEPRKPEHWSEDADNREKLEKALTKKGIALEYLFKACGVKDWDDMSRFEDEGKAAFDLAVALWQKEQEPQSEAA